MKRTDNNLIIDVVFGGQSKERDVSILSAVSIINGLVALDKYNVYALHILENGSWYRSRSIISKIISVDELKSIALIEEKVSPPVSPEDKCYYTEIHKKKILLPDLFFPVLHGPKGEDGVIQGLFSLMNIPFVGSGVLGGSLGMDKEVMRRIFESYGIPTLPWFSFTLHEWKTSREVLETKIRNEFSFPLFIKPANLGSSIGISKVTIIKDLNRAIDYAFSFDSKVVLEQGAEVREIECSVLGNDDVQVSVPGEIIPNAEFYDFDDKYQSQKSRLVIPADISEEDCLKVQTYARRAFRAINGKGLSRVDFFIVKDEGQIYINEINTFPGFTPVSMYPKLWEYSGIDFHDLLLKLIELALDIPIP